MCQEVFQIVCNMDVSFVETKMALQCAPVITGIKVSNLLIVASEDETAVRTILRKTGIIHYRLLRQGGKTTFLLFRKSQLAYQLQDPNVQHILKANGYSDMSLGGILRTFQCRFATYRNQGEGFPHEVGLLLGYPVEDVQGFIDNKGQNALYSGYWKVYQNVEDKVRLFDAYEDAKEQLILLLSNGHSMQSIVNLYRNENLHIA